ncbi:MAG TPA: bifunctional riboflavin kinase/FAD synthetase [Candidatus Rifleibacterium sp.]|nr:bifunctional riboflavin kinase/FAD synthetase [Candidatus Rifleibacterium sp.]HPT45989.1 bifunctional riboflavin kinase/FAD synthetase [Candidatus Rifleibacterium sp.]
MKLKNLLTGDPGIGPCVLGIGTFDGVHLGHRQLITEIISTARELNLPAVIFTFDHSPRKFLSPEIFKGYLTTPEEKFSLLIGTGVDHVVFRPFDEAFAAVSHEEFVNKVLVQQLQAMVTFVGFNFCFGARRVGTAEMLAHALAAQGRNCQIIEPVKVGYEVVSSSIIRDAVAAGDFARANRFLGREASFSGEVVHGDHRGRIMGFPTANLKLETSQKILPPNGVYACYADTPSGSFPAIVNIGVRPTFERSNHLLEAHLLAFNGDLYHRTIRIRFVQRIREEKRFPDMQSLIDQISRDLATLQNIIP